MVISCAHCNQVRNYVQTAIVTDSPKLRWDIAILVERWVARFIGRDIWICSQIPTLIAMGWIIAED